MIVTFDSILPKTVAPTYSWDDGLPSLTDSSLLNMQIDSEGYYIGYAPFTVLRLSSVPVLEEDILRKTFIWESLICDDPDSSSSWEGLKTDNQTRCATWEDTMSSCLNGACQDIEQKDGNVYTVYRKINFGDYYNCSQSQLTSIGFDEEYYCHVYVMPGTYEAGMTYTGYTTAVDLGQTETIFSQQESLDVEQAPVINLITENDRGRIFWKWNTLTCENGGAGIICTGQQDLANTPITWRQARCSEYYSKTWKSARSCIVTCLEAPPVLTPSKSVLNNLGNKIKVVEIAPTAYLSAIQPVDPLTRISPLSATLTARFARCGSFPIEKITWDLGDGSPILTQRRWAINTSHPFVFTGAISTDPSDLRNYDVEHVYTVTKNSGYTFYPSITCHAYSTGTTDCASTVIGPIRPQQFDSSQNRVSLLQNNLNDQKSFAVLLQVGDDTTTAKFEI